MLEHSVRSMVTELHVKVPLRLVVSTGRGADGGAALDAPMLVRDPQGAHICAARSRGKPPVHAVVSA